MEGRDPLGEPGPDPAMPPSPVAAAAAAAAAGTAQSPPPPPGYNRRHSAPARSKVVSETDDPLSRLMLDAQEPLVRENLTIRKEDEARVVSSMHNAARKQTTGSIYSVVVDLSRTGTLGIGVKDLADSVLAVSMLKRENGRPGAGEEAGIRLGDIIFGINFVPAREGSKTLIAVIKKEAAKGRSHIHIQGWRCAQLCSDRLMGYHFPRADDVIVQGYALVRSKVFSEWEMWNFVEILLGHMIEELKVRTAEGGSGGEEDLVGGSALSSVTALRAQQMQVLDLEHNILQAKGLRTALCVRIVHARHGESVVYVLRVEDVESGLQWVVQRRYSDFFALNEELLGMTHFAKEVEFPRKRLSLRNAKLVETRIVALEQYTRRMLHILTVYATMDASASRTLRHLQAFVGVDRYIDCVHPPALDDQRCIELMAYQFLNDFSSPACQQCVRFITTVDLDGVAAEGEGFAHVLSFVRDALAEVDQFVQAQHLQQMVQALRHRRPDAAEESLAAFVRRCIRRQVEAALYLPLRRTVFRIVFTFLQRSSRSLQRSITLLQFAPCSFLGVDPSVARCRALPRAVKALRRVVQAYLPADQGQLLVQAATAVAELHRECETMRLRSGSGGGGDTQEREDREREVRDKMRAAEEEEATAFMGVKTPDLQMSNEGREVGAEGRVEGREGRDNSDNTETPEGAMGAVVGGGVGGVGGVGGGGMRPKSVRVLRELFGRQKTAGDLFDSSDSEGGGEGGDQRGSGVGSPSNSPKRSERRADPLGDQRKGGSNNSNSDGNNSNGDSNSNTGGAETEDAGTGDAEAEAQASLLARLRVKAASFSGELPVQDGDGEDGDGDGYGDGDGAEQDVGADEEGEEGEEGVGAEGEEEDMVTVDQADPEASMIVTNQAEERHSGQDFEAISADDFLPLFTYVLIQAGLPQLLLVKELMAALVNDEDSYGECGYYLATLEAATQHIGDLAGDFQRDQRQKDRGIGENGELVDFL